nr:PREDICTED: uncharacterized protein LOC109030714 [Bemisia tabaci]
MFKLVVFCALTSLTAAQYHKSSKEAAIISDARYLSGNGQFGSSYTQEDGIDFKEETDAAGNRVGSYSYVDPSGQKRVISYTAGKDGFRATGDGVPVAPPPVAPLPQYNPPAQNWNRNAQNWNQNAQNWNQAPAVTERNWDDSKQWTMWDDPGTWNSGADSPTPAPVQPQPQWQQPQQQRASWAATNPQQVAWNYDPSTTTPAPHRFYPPGRLNLNRSPDGFSYTFNKN